MPIRTRIRTTEPHATPAMSQVPALLRLLHLASPALPIGAFHFSQGLEYAVEAGWVRDERSAFEWIAGIARGSLATLDLPVLYRLHAAWVLDDSEAVLRWNAFLVACRETAELRAEDRHLGAALLRVLTELGLTTELFARTTAHDQAGVTHATAFAFACARWNIAPLDVMRTYAWAWSENQVLAAVKLVPLGQSAGQRLLHALYTQIDSWSTRASHLMDSDIGLSAGCQSLASARHETQYTRLFRS
jgi:urease accessory protein